MSREESEQIQRARESIIVDYMRGKADGISNADVVALLGFRSQSAAWVVMSRAQLRGVIACVQQGSRRRWTTPDYADELLMKLARHEGAEGTTLQPRRQDRMTQIQELLKDRENGLTGHEITQAFGCLPSQVERALKLLRQAGLIGSVREGNSHRWVLSAYIKKRVIKRPPPIDYSADDPLLSYKRVVVKAGDKPPPKTSGARSIFDLAAEAA